MKKLLIVLIFITFSCSTWTMKEEKAFLKSCVKEASVNPNYTELEIQNYCDCTLNEMMLKYNRPTSNFDKQWAKATFDKCLIEAIMIN